MFIVDLIFTLVLIFLAFYSMYTVISALKIAFKTARGELDELERKVVIDSLAFTMLTIFALHGVQLILGFIINFLIRKMHYFPIISGGIPFNSFFSNGPGHFEALFFDALIFTIIYKLLQKKFAFKD